MPSANRPARQRAALARRTADIAKYSAMRPTVQGDDDTVPGTAAYIARKLATAQADCDALRRNLRIAA